MNVSLLKKKLVVVSYKGEILLFCTRFIPHMCTLSDKNMPIINTTFQYAALGTLLAIFSKLHLQN